MLIRIKILELPADTVTQSVEHLHDKHMVWIRILASVRFFTCSATFFLPMLPCRSVGRSNSDMGLHNLIILIQEKT